ncbi:hypothetical protein [Virgibacillus halodenitrificans]|uniref:hypothetical protein n=1 Tax=Virgibacillus halodenitrificans TaxID=1482 RepID=UPI000EF5353A|nr:hypothetical protein [Virgibacillus halodenitrificans]
MQLIDYPEKMRLKSNIYSYNTALKRLEKAIDQNDDCEVYASVGELLLWILTTEEWHIAHNKRYRSEKNKSDSGLVIYGLRHAYNMVKHNMNFFEIYEIKSSGGFNSFQFNTTQFNGTREYRWINGVNVIDSDKTNGKQYNNYVSYLQGKEISSTFKNSIVFLNKVNNPFLFK